MPEERLGRYRLLTLLATGGMGEVFLARQDGPAGFSKKVVIKRLLRHLAGDQGFIDLFLNEARLAATLQHPHIAQVFGLEREGDAWFMAMEYVPGRSLRALVDAAKAQRRALPMPVVVRLCAQALQGLSYAHALKDEQGRPLGILHRDVSPENILISTSGVAKLLDFGIAKAMGRAGTRVGTPKGKVAYMAPELAVSGTAVDGRADLYSLGVVLHEALLLERPAHLPATAEALAQAQRPFVPDARLPPPLAAVIGRALEVEPGRRFLGADVMGEALEAWLTSTGQTVMPGDVSRLLAELFGQHPETDLVAPIVGADGEVPAFASTGRLLAGAAPLGESSSPSLAPLSRGATSPEVTGPLRLATGSPGGSAEAPRPAPAGSGLQPRSPAGDLRSPLGESGGPHEVTGPPPAAARPAAAGTGAELAPGLPSRPAGRRDRTALGLGLLVGVVLAGGGVVATVAQRSSSDDVTLSAEELQSEGVLFPEIVLDGSDEPDAGPRGPSAPRPGPRPLGARGVVKKGRLLVRVNPWAEVWLGRRKVGVTPMRAFELPAGRVTVTLKNPELKVVRTEVVRVLPGAEVLLRVDLFDRAR